MRISLRSHARLALLAALPILAGVLLALPCTTRAAEAEACPNEPYRVAADSTRLPGCRAYELVSPADAEGPVMASSIYTIDDTSTFLQHGTGEGELALDGNLLPQTLSSLDVQANGSAVFWQDRLATLPGTGKIEDGGVFDAFRSARTPSGWVTRDLLPSGLQLPENPGGVDKVILGASADGSSALVQASLALYPNIFVNPQQAELGEWNGYLIYRVFADGAPPQLVSRFDRQIPENANLPSAGPFQAVSASPDLSVVALRSVLALEANDTCNTTASGFREASMYLWNASSVDGLAHTIFDFGLSPCTNPNVIDAPAILPDGRPILNPNPAGNPGIPDSGPLVENNAWTLGGGLTPLAGPSGGKLLAYTPDSATAYVQAADAIDSNFPGAATGTYDSNYNTCTGGCQIYAVSTTLGSKASENGTTPGVTCISCASDQVNVTYIAMSKDGAHVLFTTDQGLWEWNAASGAQLLTAAKDLGPQTVVVSENGQYVLAMSSEGLLPSDTNNGPDLYELSVGQASTLLTSGATPADNYTLTDGGPEGVFGAIAGVSNDGQRAVYNRTPASGDPREVIDEWDAGQTTQLSPLSPQGSASQYQVLEVDGPQLQDVFFIGLDPLVPWDFNAGQADYYDARIDGGFPFCTPGNPGPPPGAERCGSTTSNANPTITPPAGYTANLTPPSSQLAVLPADSSQPPASAPAPKALTRAQKLAKALGTCRSRDRAHKRARATCEAQARKRYGAKASKRSEKGRK